MGHSCLCERFVLWRHPAEPDTVRSIDVLKCVMMLPVAALYHDKLYIA